MKLYYIYLFCFITLLNTQYLECAIFSNFKINTLKYNNQAVTFLNGDFTEDYGCFLGQTGANPPKIYFVNKDNVKSANGTLTLTLGIQMTSTEIPNLSSYNIIAIAATTVDRTCFVATNSNIIHVKFLNSTIQFTISPTTTITTHTNQLFAYDTGESGSDPSIVYTTLVGSILYFNRFSYSTSTSAFYGYLQKHITNAGTNLIANTQIDKYHRINAMTSIGVVMLSIYDENQYPVTYPFTNNAGLGFVYTGFYTDGDTLYSCVKNDTAVYLEGKSVSNSQIFVIYITADSIECTGITKDPLQERLIVSFKFSSNGNLGLIYVSSVSSDPQVVTMVVSPTVSTTTWNTSRPNFITIYKPYEKSVFIGLPSSTATQNGILSFDYSSFCQSDCSGNHGACVYQGSYICSCQTSPKFYYGDICEKVLPRVDYIKTPFYGGQTTIYGSDFTNSGDYNISVVSPATIQCTNLQYLNTTSAICQLDTIQNDPLPATINVNVTAISVPELTLNFTTISDFYLSPIVTSVTQINDNIIFTGSNFFDSAYQFVTLNDTDLICVNNKTASQCNLNQSYYSSNLVLKVPNLDQNPFYDQPFTLKPYITATIPPYIPTSSSDVTIKGKFFTSNPNLTTKVKYAGQTLSPFSNDFEYTSFIVTLPDGIPLSRQLSIVVGDNVVASNSFEILYVAPSLTQYTQNEDTHNKFTLTGSDFGNLTQLISVSIDPVSANDNYNATVLSASGDTMEIQLPNNAEKGSVTVKVAGSESNSIPFNLRPKITGLAQLPSTNGSNSITIQGEYLIDAGFTFNGDEIFCTGYSTLNYPTSWADCAYISGSGKFELIANSNLQSQFLISDAFHATYRPPSIVTISPTSYKKSQNVTFVITGYDMVSTNLTIQIQGEDCVIKENNLPNNVSCNLKSEIDPSTTQNPVSIKISSDGVVGYNNSTLIYEKPCLNACSSQGTCDVVTGKCQCNDGFTGDDCSTIVDVSSSSTITITLLISILFNIISLQ
ncbi:hypothetical protein DLAC_01967 [Tieghemostelium lacteum]|uniref:EGF-like domain-containing protein n=1 Tax=Tieghemostelium lacteum TaxID=361077 RepID=A0A152A572_TIELA|nr:hypothetical protein DLAC_01967 [Tieghemostelium lacteum]|eukprot:KYR01380.1 hypothetical protein DLAC_01967 [Tieghemostelium lacteum]